MQDIAYETRPPLAFTDRSARLITIGILLLCIACLTGGLTALTPFINYLPAEPDEVPMSKAGIASALIFYGAITFALAALGIGLLLRRKWSLPLTRIAAVHAMLIGGFTAITITAFMPGVRAMMYAEANNFAYPPHVMFGIAVGVFLVLSLMAVGVPAVVFWTLRTRDALATVEYFDSRVRWTDRLPPRVLGLVITLATATILMATLIGYTALPVLWFTVEGTGVYAISAVLTGAMAMATVETYRLRPRGWRIAAAAHLLFTLMTVPGTLFAPIAPLLMQSGFTQADLSHFARFEWTIRLTLAAAFLVWGIGFCVYLLRLKPTFDRTTATAIS